MMRPRARASAARSVLFALLIPVLFVLAAIVITLGNWYTHAKNLQTKADAAAFAGGDRWAFPCGPDSDTNATGTGIVDVARDYFGRQMTAAGAVTLLAAQPTDRWRTGTDIHVVMNGNAYWDDDAGSNPADQPSPAGSVCEAKILDVKATEANSFPLCERAAFLPRPEAQGASSDRGGGRVSPASFRSPCESRGRSAPSAIFYNEQNGNIISKQPMREVCTPPSVPAASRRAGRARSVDDGSGERGAPIPGVSVATTTGVVIAISFRAGMQCAGCDRSVPERQPAGRAGTHHEVLQPEPDRHVLGRDRRSRLADRRVRRAVHPWLRQYADGNWRTSLRTAYFRPSGTCRAVLQLPPDRLLSDPQCRSRPRRPRSGDPPGRRRHLEPLRAQDVQVRYSVERANGTDDCAGYGN